MNARTEGWKKLFETQALFFLGQKHKDVHYKQVCFDLIPYALEHRNRVLNFGCGEDCHSHILSLHCDGLLLYDQSPCVRKTLHEDYALNEAIVLLDDAALEAMPENDVAAIFCVSVLPYLSKEDATALLARLDRWLKPGGLLVLGNILPPKSNTFSYVLSFAWFALFNNFFLPALFGLARLATSPYARMRFTVGLTRHAFADLSDALQAMGYHVERAQKNIGPNRQRYTLLAQKPNKEGFEEPRTKTYNTTMLLKDFDFRDFATLQEEARQRAERIARETAQVGGTGHAPEAENDKADNETMPPEPTQKPQEN